MSDILDSVLELEEASYQIGFIEGEADGATAGYEEGKVFGIERGYQKGFEMGRIHGRALMLNACLSEPNPMSEDVTGPSPVKTEPPDRATEDHQIASVMSNLPTLAENPRLKKHAETLLKLTNPNTLSVENSDNAVAEFDDRMKKAAAKAKVMSRSLPEPYNTIVSGDSAETTTRPARGSDNIEELTNLAVRR